MYPQPGQQQQYQPAPPPPAPTERQIFGTLSSVEQRSNGWMRFSIMEPGKQYAVKADTKQPEIIQQAMALMGQPVAVLAAEQQSTNINPHNGRPYVNRYLNQIAPAQPGMVAPQAPQQPQMAPQPPQQFSGPQQPAQQPQGGFVDQREMQIMRQAAAKVVAASIDALPPDRRGPIDMIAACEVWMAYFVHGPLHYGLQPFGGAHPQQASAQVPQQPVWQPGGAPSTAQQGNVDIFGAPVDGDPGQDASYYDSIAQ